MGDLCLQLVDNLGSLAIKAKLTPEIMAKIDNIMGNKPDAPKSYR